MGTLMGDVDGVGAHEGDSRGGFSNEQPCSTACWPPVLGPKTLLNELLNRLKGAPAVLDPKGAPLDVANHSDRAPN